MGSEEEKFNAILQVIDEKLDSFKHGWRKESLELIDYSVSKNLDRIKQDLVEHFSQENADKGSSRASGDEKQGRIETERQSSIRGASGQEEVHRSPVLDSAADKEVKSSAKVIDYQGEFAVIRDSLAKLKLPVELKFAPNPSGINKEDKSVYALLRTSSSYVETNLKIISLLQQGEYSLEDAITDLHLVNSAHVRLLKEEHSTLLVQGRFSKDTASMFKALRKEGNSFTHDQLETLQVAANLTQHHRTEDSQNRGRGNRGRGNSRFGRGRGGYNRDFYSRFTQQDTSSQIPSSNNNV